MRNRVRGRQCSRAGGDRTHDRGIISGAPIVYKVSSVHAALLSPIRLPPMWVRVRHVL
jgi:hypothetical protein